MKSVLILFAMMASAAMAAEPASTKNTAVSGSGVVAPGHWCDTCGKFVVNSSATNVHSGLGGEFSASSYESLAPAGAPGKTAPGATQDGKE